MMIVTMTIITTTKMARSAARTPTVVLEMMTTGEGAVCVCVCVWAATATQDNDRGGTNP